MLEINDLYNCFEYNLKKDPEYYKKRDGFYDMFSILDEVSFARNKGLDIFNELAISEKELQTDLSNLKAHNHGTRAAPSTVYIKFKTKIASLLQNYEDAIKDKLVEMLNGNDLIRYCNNDYLFANNKIYQCYPISNFNFSLKHIDDFYNDSFGDYFRKMSKYLNSLKNEFHVNYLLYLRKWLSKDVKDIKTDLFTSVNNLLNRFYEVSDFLCKRYDNFDTMFYWFDSLMRDINKEIVDSFDNKDCILYYGDLKRELVNNNRIQENFYKIYDNFSLNLLNDFYPKEKYVNENEVLKFYFFSEDTVLGEGQQDQKEELQVISRLLIEINYDWMREITSKKIFISDKFPFYASSQHYEVDSKSEKGVLQILKDDKKHHYICDYIQRDCIINKDSNFLTNLIDKIFLENDVVDEYGDSYRVLSKRMYLFYDSFYIYFMIDNDLKFKIYYKNVFPSIDVAVLTLACHVFRIENIYLDRTVS